MAPAQGVAHATCLHTSSHNAPYLRQLSAGGCLAYEQHCCVAYRSTPEGSHGGMITSEQCFLPACTYDHKQHTCGGHMALLLLMQPSSSPEALWLGQAAKMLLLAIIPAESQGLPLCLDAKCLHASAAAAEPNDTAACICKSAHPPVTLGCHCNHLMLGCAAVVTATSPAQGSTLLQAPAHCAREGS
jgi:hypothetical protein